MTSEQFDSPTEYDGEYSDSFSLDPSIDYTSEPDTGMVVHSHLDPGKSRRIYVGNKPSVSWNAPASEESPSADDSGRDPFVVVPDLSEDEFMERLTGEGVTSRNDAPVSPSRTATRSGPWRLPEAPRFAQEDDDAEETAPTPVTVKITVVALLALSVITIGAVCLQRFSRSNQWEGSVEYEPLSVTGQVWRRTAAGLSEADESALVFVMPTTPPTQPLTIGDVSPQKTQALEDEELQSRLNKAGIYVAIVDFTGWFEVKLPEEGTYNVLIVSGSIAATQDDQNEETLREIGQYFYLPERALLQRNKFLWSRRQLSKSSDTIETEFRGTALQ